ncbi:hypothetical protein [Cupriavidus necator]|nr:hypothetical protein N234_29785 [Ralstonia pickettii DTP0602]
MHTPRAWRMTSAVRTHQQEAAHGLQARRHIAGTVGHSLSLQAAHEE